LAVGQVETTNKKETALDGLSGRTKARSPGCGIFERDNNPRGRRKPIPVNCKLIKDYLDASDIYSSDWLKFH
jgi:hypothetical protein